MPALRGLARLELVPPRGRGGDPGRGLARSVSAAMTEPMSPTSGAAIGWLLSSSLASMSTWMNLASGTMSAPRRGRAASSAARRPASRRPPWPAPATGPSPPTAGDRRAAGPWPSTSAGTGCRWTRGTPGSRRRPGRTPRPCRARPAAAVRRRAATAPGPRPPARAAAGARDRSAGHSDAAPATASITSPSTAPGTSR